MSLQIGGRSWAQWNWMDRLPAGPVPTIAGELQAFFAAVNPNHPGHELSMPVLPNKGNPALDIGFRIKLDHPLGAWSVLMTTRTLDPPIQHTSRDKLSLQWDTGFDAAYRPNGSGLAYGDFDPNSPGRWLFQQGMPYINYSGVGGTILMFRDTTPGRESIFFWLANHGTPVASNPFYAPQWFSLAWQDSINSWLFVTRSYRNARPAGTDQSGPASLTVSLWPNGSIWSGLGIGMQSSTDVLWSNPYLIYPSTTTMSSLIDVDEGGEASRFPYPPCMVAGYLLTTTTAGRSFDGNVLNVPGFPTLYQLGTFSTVNTSLTSDDFLFFHLPPTYSVPSGWLPVIDAYPWRAAVDLPARLRQEPTPAWLGQASLNIPDGEQTFWPQLVGLSQVAGHPFYERFAGDLIGGGGGGGECGSGRPAAGVLWPRRG